MRILLGQLGARGDCVLASIVARQIKNDYPRAIVTWAVGSNCVEIAKGNPFVDIVWEWNSCGDAIQSWYAFESEALSRKASGEFDAVYFTQIHPENYQNFDGTVRASIFRGYPKPITTSVQPVIRLGQNAIDHVTEFCIQHGVSSYKQRVLLECSAHSRQSFINTQFGVELAQQLTEKNSDIIVIISSDGELAYADKQIVDASVLTFVENAELIRQCNFLIGGSSGISWLCTSDWAKMPPTIQLLERSTSVYASMVHDHKYFGLPHEHVIEMTNCDVKSVVDCFQYATKNGFAVAKTIYHEELVPDFKFYGRTIKRFIRTQQYSKARLSAKYSIGRYGYDRNLLKMLALNVWKGLIARIF